MDDQIIDRCKKGDLLAIQAWLDVDPGRITVRAPHGETLLHWGCTSGKSEFVKFLLDRGLPVNGENWRGACPLIYAAIASGSSDSKEELKIVHILLKRGADPRDKSGFSGRSASQTAHNPAVRAVITIAEVALNLAIEIDDRINYRYRTAKWRRTSAHYLGAPKHIRQSQFPPVYKLAPEVQAAFDHGGEIEAWQFCAKSDQAFARIDLSGEDRCAHCDVKSPTINCDRCQIRFCSVECQAAAKLVHESVIHR